MKHNKIYKSVIVFGLIGFAITFSNCRGNKDELVLALPTSDWWTAAPFLASTYDSLNRLKDVDVKIMEVNSGLASKNAVVAGTADIGITAATPLALAASNKEDIIVHAVYLKSNSIVGLVVPESDSLGKLPASPVSIVPSTISQWFLYEYLKYLGNEDLMKNGSLKELHVRPADIPGTLRSKSAKSAVIWEPFLSFCANENGYKRDDTFKAFEVQLYIITTKRFAEENPSIINKFIQVLDASCQDLIQNSDARRKEIEKHFGFENGFLTNTWSKVKYGILREKADMVLEVKRDSEIAVELGQSKEIPDFNYMFDHLK